MRVLVIQQQELGRAVPSCHHVLRHQRARLEPGRPCPLAPTAAAAAVHTAALAVDPWHEITRLNHFLVERASEPKIGDAQVAFAVDQDVRGLQVTMHDVGRVQELNAAEQLVEEVAHVILRERLWRCNHARQV